jgi:RND family efflux transporter MFP subunit
MGSHRRTSTLSLTTVAAVLAAAALSPVRAQSAPPLPPSSGASITQIEAGITRPYEERKLQFNQPAVVTSVNVKPGDAIKEGQVLAQQDVSVEQAEREGLVIEATSTVQEDFAKADQALNEKKFEKQEYLFKTKNSSFFEVEEARLAIEKSKASVKISVEERAKAAAKLKGVDARISLKTLKSPVTGFVQQIDTGVGEVGGIDQQKSSMVVVQNDPVKVDVPVPVREANRLQVGQTLQVRYTDDDNAKWQPAKILAMLPVADRGSQTRGIVLELPNPNNKPSGLRVDVNLGSAPPTPAAANAGGQR